MDRGKQIEKFRAARSSNVHMDLKDVIREHTLHFLPAKSLVKFQSVCRDWKHQISTPFFAHNQSLSCRAVSGLFCQHHGNPPFFIPINPNASGIPDPSLSFLPEPVEIRSSSHGLLCCQGQNGDRLYYVCNPATMQWTKLPKPNASHGSDPALVLIFEPSRLNFMAEYKLICAFPSADFDDATEFDIYSSRDNSWNVSGEICFGVKKVMPMSGVHVNGVVYWKMSSGILLFDLTKDRSLLLKSYYDGALGNFDGKFCKVNINGYRISVSILVNVHANTMEATGKTKMWDDNMQFDFNNHALDLNRSTMGSRAILIDNDILVMRNGKKVYSYDFKSKALEELTWAAEWSDSMRFVPYVNSLVSL